MASFADVGTDEEDYLDDDDDPELTALAFAALAAAEEEEEGQGYTEDEDEEASQEPSGPPPPTRADEEEPSTPPPDATDAEPSAPPPSEPAGAPPAEPAGAPPAEEEAVQYENAFGTLTPPGSPQKKNNDNGGHELTTISEPTFALRKALSFQSLSPTWQQLVWWPWYRLSGALFVSAMSFYCAAYAVLLQVESKHESERDYALFDFLNLMGAIVFSLEPIADMISCWSNAWVYILEQAKWEATDKSTHLADDAGLDDMASQCGGSGVGGWSQYRRWKREYSVLHFMLRDWTFWAAVFFEVAVMVYLYGGLLPFMYDDYCQCNDTRVACGGPGNGTEWNPTHGDGSWDRPQPAAKPIPQVYACEVNWLGAFFWTFDATLGLLAWKFKTVYLDMRYGFQHTMIPCWNRKSAHKKNDVGEAGLLDIQLDNDYDDYLFDWQGTAALAFLTGGLLELANCFVNTTMLEFVAQLWWMVTAICFCIDSMRGEPDTYIPSRLGQGDGQVTCAWNRPAERKGSKWTRYIESRFESATDKLVELTKFDSLADDDVRKVALQKARQLKSDLVSAPGAAVDYVKRKASPRGPKKFENSGFGELTLN